MGLTTRRIAICADDFGLNGKVNSAILALTERGRLTATSCMVGAPSWRADAPSLRQASAAQGLDAGLHLDLTEFPANAALRRPLRAWMLDALLRRVDQDRVRQEIRIQLDRFEQAMGHAPSHVDGHQHVHQFPGVRDALLEELLERYGHAPVRPWLRSTRRAPAAGFKAWVIEHTGAPGLDALCGRHGFAHNRALLGVYDFRGGPLRYEALLRDWLAHAKDGDLLMCHPAWSFEPGDEIGAARADECRVLSDAAFDGWLAQAGVSLARMSHLMEQGPAAEERARMTPSS